MTPASASDGSRATAGRVRPFRHPVTRLILVLASLTLAAGCEAPPPKAAEGHSIVRQRLHFAIDVPAGWTFRDLYGDVVLEMHPRGAPVVGSVEKPATPAAGEAKPPEAGAQGRPLGRSITVVHVVAIDRDHASLADWADQAIKDSRELQTDLEVTRREATHLADGRDALRLVLKNPRGVQPMVQEMLLVVTDRRAFAVLATAPESELSAADAAFKKCFDSFIVW